MWPFKQQKTITRAVELHIEPPTTADGHRLDEMVVCFDCHQLVLKKKAKAVEHRYPRRGYHSSGQGRVEVKDPNATFYYCPTHTPAWDVVQHDIWPYSSHCYRRIPAVPERLEEIDEAPVKAPRKQNTGKGTG